MVMHNLRLPPFLHYSGWILYDSAGSRLVQRNGFVAPSLWPSRWHPNGLAETLPIVLR